MLNIIRLMGERYRIDLLVSQVFCAIIAPQMVVSNQYRALIAHASQNY